MTSERAPHVCISTGAYLRPHFESGETLASGGIDS